jgi:hypothetical protein
MKLKTQHATSSRSQLFDDIVSSVAARPGVLAARRVRVGLSSLPVAPGSRRSMTPTVDANPVSEDTTRRTVRLVGTVILRDHPLHARRTAGGVRSRFRFPDVRLTWCRQ